MGKKKYFSDSEIKNMVSMYKDNLESIPKIAEKYHVDNSVIKNRLEKQGVKIAKGSPYNIKYWLDRGLTECQAKEHIKTLRPVNKEYWIKLGYKEHEAILQIEGQKLVSLRGCIARFGKIDGKKIWTDRENLRSENGKKGSANLFYWLNKGYSLSEAEEMRRLRQKTFSKDKCIQKYGEKEGLKIFNERQIKWQESLYRNGKLKSGYSSISQELFFELLKYYEVEESNLIFFAKKGGEYVIKGGDNFYRYDFTDLNNKKIIEYNGDCYHANPKKYLAEDHPHPFRKDLTSQEIWDKDLNKIKLANQKGFKVLSIWDSDYTNGNKNNIIKKCVEFLNKNWYEKKD